MNDILLPPSESPQAIPIWFAATESYSAVCEQLDPKARAFANAAGFEPKPGRHLLLPNSAGALAGVLFGLEPAETSTRDLFLPGKLPGLLPVGVYRFANDPHDTRLAALAFALGSYRFSRYRKAEDREPHLIDIGFGEPAAPKVTLVGKGVCFDSGGLDIKSDSAMLLMKKDMGGAAS